ncbi:MAG TPA: DUF72 domain-containing protein [Candidatus Acidoferrales bacterium]|nr:DUF72 domain-containing protein [Candidatus Acidoferrales bacterium]
MGLTQTGGVQSIRIGTAGYSYPGPPPKGWHGAFYPQARGKRIDELEYYSRIFNTVEINSSFYGPPSARMAHAWVTKTPEDFLFTLKLWQKFTHPEKIGQGRSTGRWEPFTQADVDLFKTGIQPLAEAAKLGALVLQYPAGFYCNPENVERLSGTLRAFADYPKAVELRHRSWSDKLGQTRALLEEHGASWVLIDEPKFATSIRQPFEAIGDILYFRAHGRNAQAWWRHDESWQRYDYLYSREEIQRIAEKLKNAAAKPGVRQTFAVFNNHARANAAVNAIMLAQELNVPLRSLPNEGLIARFPALAKS